MSIGVGVDRSKGRRGPMARRLIAKEEKVLNSTYCLMDNATMRVKWPWLQVTHWAMWGFKVDHKRNKFIYSIIAKLVYITSHMT